MKVDVDIRTLELQLNNGLVTTPAEIRLSWEGVDLVAYTPSGDDDMAAHQISLRLSGSRLDLIIRSPLGATPERRTLYDFAANVDHIDAPPLISPPKRDEVSATVELPRVQYDLAVDIGAGSFSAGVRQALRKYP